MSPSSAKRGSWRVSKLNWRLSSQENLIQLRPKRNERYLCRKGWILMPGSMSLRKRRRMRTVRMT